MATSNGGQTQHGKPFGLALPKNHDWAQLEILPHFILWGRITAKEIAHLAITDRKINATVWESRLVPYRDRLDVIGHVEAKRIIEKFERLWPCHFLAKEYYREGI
jgi:hypothetical protein